MTILCSDVRKKPSPISRYNAVGALLWGALSAFVIPTQAETLELVNYQPAVQLCELEKRDITESSGLALSTKYADRFWTHNDSGDKPRLFAFDRQGRHLGTSRVAGADAVDWEDMATATIDEQAYLIVGDIGDNGKRRKKCTIYLIPEPENPKKDANVGRRIDFSFDPPVDCEAMAFVPDTREILLFEKKLGLSCQVFSLPLDKSESQLVARHIATVPIPLATAADVSRDGSRLIVATYGQSYLYEREQGETWPRRLRSQGRVIPTPVRRQGETICFGADSKTLYYTSEKQPTPLFEMRPAAPAN
jgi:hypothetical protein